MRRFIRTIIFLLCIIPIGVKAYGIENYYINATVKDNGDLEVEEYFEMNGTYNGMERIINYKNNNAYNFNPDASSYGGHSLHNGDSMEIEEVRAVKIDHNFNFKDVSGTKFKLVSYADKGDYGVYTSRDNYSSDGKTIKIFLPSKKNKAFYVKYKLHNMAILHNDIGELGWNAVGSGLSESIGKLVIYINIPDNKDTTKVWAHGPLNGTSEIISKDKIKATINGLNSYTALDVRIAFDKEVIKNSTKKSNVDALEKIIKYEEDLAEQANELRRQSDERYEEYIKTNLEYMEKYPSRAEYDTTLGYINMLNKSDKKIEYLKKLMAFQDKVDEYEYGIFKETLSFELDKKHYEDAKLMINNVFNEELHLKMEKELDAYYRRLQRKNLKTEIILSSISIGTILIALYAYYKPIKFKKRVNPYYYRDIPSDLSPAAVGILVDKRINKNEVSASILDLIRRKVVQIEKKDNGTYDFVLNKEYEELSESDKKIFALIFGNKTTTRVNSKKIKKIHFTTFEKFRNSIIDELNDKKMMKDYIPTADEINGVLFEVGLILSFTPLFPLGLLLMLIYSISRYHENFYIWVFILFNIFIMILSIALNSTVLHISIYIALVAIIIIKILIKRLPIKLDIKYTKIGKEEYQKWHGLRNFLMDFSKIDDRAIKEISLWEKYLVYATALGVSKKVLKAIKVKIEEQNPDFDYSTLNDMMTMDYISSSINRISNNVVASSLPSVSYPIASALASGSSGGSYSSGSGGGGGFSGGSSGGGSFGGGGGGGRF